MAFVLARRSSPIARRRPRGVTMMELLVVLVILSITLGLAVTFFRSMNQDLGVRAATNRVVSILRGAGEHARGEGLPVEVVFDVEGRSLQALTEETAGMWHFEDEQGAFGRRAVLGDVIPVPGYFGGAYQFKGGSTVSCGTIPVNTAEAGLVIDLYLKRSLRMRSSTRKPMTICSIGADVELAIQVDGRLEAHVGERKVNSGLEKIRPDEWARVTLAYTTLDTRLYVNGTEVGITPGKASWATTPPFIVGSREAGFVGTIDEVRVALVLPHDAYTLPAETAFSFPPGTPLRDRRFFTVWFDEQGRLDSRKHSAAVSVTIKSATDSKTVGVQLTGVVGR